MNTIPLSYSDLLSDDTKALAYLSTVMADGSPQVTPVWFNFDGEHILVNSALGRVKDRNMRREPRVALAIQDPEDLYRYLQVRGKVIEITLEGAREHIDALSKKYTGRERFIPNNPDEQRVVYKILPVKVEPAE